MTPNRRKLSPNEVLYREGDPSQSFYVILSGVISLYNERDGRVIERTRLSGNAIVGDLGYFNPQPRTSAARAVGEAEVVEFPYSEIAVDMKTLPGWAQLMMKNFGEQIQTSVREIRALRGDTGGKLLPEDILRGAATLRLATETLPPEKDKWDWDKVREYAVQVFQFPVLKLEPIAIALGKAEWLKIEMKDGGVGSIASLNRARVAQFEEFVRYYRYSRGKRAVIEMNQTDLIVITALVDAAQGKADAYRGAAKVFLPDVIAKAQAMPGGSSIKMDQIELLAGRGLDIVKQSSEDGLFASFNLAEFESIRDNWRVLLMLA